MIIVNNPFGLDPADFDEQTAANRIGNRIKRIRLERGLSQAELGERVGLNGDRMQKYESGARKPKDELLKEIAIALNVSVSALTDPNTTSYIGAMYAFFEMEKHFNIKIEKTPEDREPGMCVTVNFRDGLYKYMKEWYDIYSSTQTEIDLASSEEEKSAIMKNYYNWEWSFPKGIVDRTSREMQKQRIKDKIEELQEAYDILNGKNENGENE